MYYKLYYSSTHYKSTCKSDYQLTSSVIHSHLLIHSVVTQVIIREDKISREAAILEVQVCRNQNTAGIRVSEIGFSSKFLYFYLFLKYQKNRNIGSGNNQKALNQARILEFDFPLCLIKEQTQIVKEIETRLSVCDKLETTLKQSLQQAQSLRQSILKKAFEGKLLTTAELATCKQAKDYESASELLKRIKEEKNNS